MYNLSEVTVDGATLECWLTDILNTFCFSGFPKPRVYWFKDGHPLRSSERVLLQVERDVHNLEILEVKREDMGEYSAYISNAAGSAYSSARLSVLSMCLNDCWEWQQKRKC